MRSITVELPDEVIERCESEAAARKLSLEDVLREAMELAFTTPAPRSAWDAMQDMCGMMEGPGDLSTNPKYMEGFGRD